MCIVIGRGFVKYKRATNQYRPPEQRLQDWGEVYNHKGVMDGLRTQAARYVGVNVDVIMLRVHTAGYVVYTVHVTYIYVCNVFTYEPTADKNDKRN